jgi:hypothetical protein
MSAMDRIPMPPKLAALQADETAAFGLRLMRSFLKLRDRAHRRELIALAERLVEKEERFSIEPGE